MVICKRCKVSGIVQGVFYRASTQQKAAALGVTGWVRNLPDRNVEVLACGQYDQVEDLVQWLWNGPPQARVTDVITNDEALQAFDNFHIRYD